MNNGAKHDVLEYQIRVMQHFKNGGEVDVSSLFSNPPWTKVEDPSWNWSEFDYRISRINRDNFEAWFGKFYSKYALQSYDEVKMKYSNMETELAWQAWKAATTEK